MNEEIKDRLRQHAGKILLGGSGALLALSVLTLVSGLLSDGTVTSLDAYRASGKTRDALAAASEERPSPKPTG
ncbi:MULTISPECIES: hypothetical protein [unclassified Kitasatospora]|uniref:hypothetical protein n=1 Tax=unclassified Kitasatospora TaxID=2633591 RepID=UPI003804D45C